MKVCEQLESEEAKYVQHGSHTKKAVNKIKHNFWFNFTVYLLKATYFYTQLTLEPYFD